MTRLHDGLPFDAARRNPPYRELEDLSPDELALLAEELGDARAYAHTEILQELAQRDPRFLVPIVAGLLSAEFRGVDFIGRFVVESQRFEVPWHMTLGFARQASDEARHVRLDTQLLEHLDSDVGDYPELPFFPQIDGIRPEELDPAILMGAINVGLEGYVLSLFEKYRKLARKHGEDLIDHCFDYNDADEITHVALGDYWVDELARSEPWRDEWARLGQKAVEESNAANKELVAALVTAAHEQHEVQP